MINRNKKVILFIALMLIMATGLSYVALTVNQKPLKKFETKAKTMSVALVNEDEGVDFNQEHISFGNAFVKNIEKDNDYDWYVVSRGVAESGLERNLYNMMIVIPNDFSQKAVAIDAEQPEPVSLYYKVNTTGNDEIKIQAEKTASEILNDFNRRVIDVYFASILNNLQEAQQNVATIIKNEEKYANTYDQSIHNPLSQYTDQFDLIKVHTESSKSQFGSFEDLLKGIEENMNSELTDRKEQQSVMTDALAQRQGQEPLYTNLFDQLNILDSSVNRSPILQIEQLEDANEAVYNKFQKRNQNASVLMTEHSNQIQAYLRKQNEQVQALNDEVTQKLNQDLKNRVEKQLSSSFNKSFADDSLNLSVFFANPDKEARKRIERHIELLPSLSMADIAGAGLPESMENRIANVMAVTKSYNKEFGFKPEQSADKGKLLSKQIEALREHLETEGISVEDEIEIPQNKKDKQYFTITIPKEFSASQMIVKLPNGGIYQLNEQSQALELPANEAGALKIQMQLRLKKSAEKVDIFAPVQVGWQLIQKDIHNNEEKLNALTKEKGKSDQQVKIENQSTRNTVTNLQVMPLVTHDETINGEVEEPNEVETGTPEDTEGEGSSEVETGTPEQPLPEQNEQSNSENDGTPDESTEETTDPEDPETEEKDERIEAIDITNHTIRHKLTISLLDNVSETLVNSTIDTIRDYEQMQSLYELYFGINLSRSNLQDELKEAGLKSMASSSSLYYLFNQKNLSDLFKDYAVSRILDDVTAHMDASLTDLQKKIQVFQEYVQLTDEESSQLGDKLVLTATEAENLNRQLNEVLRDAIVWRKNSLKLLEAQPALAQAQDDEQKMTLALDRSFQSFLASSELLAFDAKANVSSAESVYQTFELIDKEAAKIQESGLGLIKEANNLSVVMGKQLLDDKEFANNFGQVLANSRIGGRPNENLHEFLSNPVKTKNSGMIANETEEKEQQSISTFEYVLIGFIISLFTAYAISVWNDKRKIETEFESRRAMILALNTPVLFVTSIIALIEGLIIGGVTASSLEMDTGDTILWVSTFVLMMLGMLLISSYLLRQLKLIGMFGLLVVLSIYVLFARSINRGTVAPTVEKFSPLHYLDNMLYSLLQGEAGIVHAMIALVILVIVGMILNLFVFQLSGMDEVEGNERATKAS